MNIRRVLLWEIIGYWPPAAGILESSNKELGSNLSSDLSYIHFFLEDVYSEGDARSQNWN